MKVCAGCEHEYDEEFKFCPECGHRFGAAAEQEANILNRALRTQAGSAEREAALGRRASAGPLNVNPNFTLSSQSRSTIEALWGQMEAGLKGTGLEDDGHGDGRGID